MSLRINRSLSDVGIGLHRKVEKYITAERVVLNGERAELANTVVEDDIVTLDGEKFPVDDILCEALLMKHYLEVQQEDRGSREAAREHSSQGGGRPNHSIKSDPKRMRSDQYSDEPREPKGHTKGSEPYKTRGGSVHGRRRDNRGRDFSGDDRW